MRCRVDKEVAKMTEQQAKYAVSALDKLIFEIEKHAAFRAYASFSLVQDARKELAAYKRVAEAARRIAIGCRGIAYWDDLNDTLEELDKTVRK